MVFDSLNRRIMLTVTLVRIVVFLQVAGFMRTRIIRLEKDAKSEELTLMLIFLEESTAAQSAFFACQLHTSDLMRYIIRIRGR